MVYPHVRAIEHLWWLLQVAKLQWWNIVTVDRSATGADRWYISGSVLFQELAYFFPFLSVLLKQARARRGIYWRSGPIREWNDGLAVFGGCWSRGKSSGLLSSLLLSNLNLIRCFVDILRGLEAIIARSITDMVCIKSIKCWNLAMWALNLSNDASRWLVAAGQGLLRDHALLVKDVVRAMVTLYQHLLLSFISTLQHLLSLWLIVLREL